jgi:hypothetical protein
VWTLFWIVLLLVLVLVLDNPSKIEDEDDAW